MILKILLLLAFSLNAGADVFTVRSSLPEFKEVARKANCIVKNPAFLAEIGAVAKFTHTPKSTPQVVEAIKAYKAAIISTYYKKYSVFPRLTKTLAYRNTKGKETNVIYFNTAKFPRSEKSMINTAVHEWLHVSGFGHGDNSPRGKEKSVPYLVGDIAEKYLGACP